MGPGLPEGVIERVLDLFYPRLTCPVCGNFGEGLCPECGNRLRKPEDEEAGEEGMRAGVSLYLHDEVTMKLINRYKLKSGFNALEEMGKRLAAEYPAYIASFDMVSFAPSSRTSMKRLGFDHGYLLAKAVARRSGLPVVRLFAPPEKEQKQLDREERKDNAGTIVFLGQLMRKGAVPLIEGKRVLLVDDVLTTGATLEACSALILGMGGDSAYLTFSRV